MAEDGAPSLPSPQWWADVAALMNDRADMWEQEGRPCEMHECRGLANAFRTYAEGVGIPSMETLRKKRRAAEDEVERLQNFQNELAERMPPEFDGDEAQEYLIDNWITSLIRERDEARAQLAQIKGASNG